MIYTINGKHSDVYGNFTITAQDLGLADKVHMHGENDIENLETLLNDKSDLTHSHVAVKSIQVGNGAALTESVSISSVGATISISGQDLTITSQITTDVDLNNAPSVVNWQNKKPAYLYTSGPWSTLHNSRLGRGYSPAAVTDVNAMFAFTSKLTRPIADIFLYQNGTVTKVTQVKDETDQSYYPPPAFDKIQMTSVDLDKIGIRKAAEGEQYEIPILNVSNNTFEVVVTPYPANGKWYLECDQFDIPKVVYTGKQTVLITVPDLEVGTYLCTVYAKPAHDTNPTTVWGYRDSSSFIKFYRVITPSSDVQPDYYWSLDNTMVEAIHNLQGVYHGETEDETPTFSDNAVNGYAYKSKRQYTTVPEVNGICTDNVVVDPRENGLSLSMFIKPDVDNPGRNSQTYVWFAGSNKESQLGIVESYGSPNLVWFGVQQNVPTVVLANTRWTHWCFTISKPLTEADGYTASQLNNAWYFRAKLYIDGEEKWSKDLLVYKSHASRFDHIGGDTHQFRIGSITTRNQNDWLFDEIKIYKTELSLDDVRKETASAGIIVDGGDTPKPTKLPDEPRIAENAPSDPTTIPLSADLKVFVIDQNTIAVGGNFETFYNARLRAEYTKSLPNMEQNYRNGFQPKWKHEFYYNHTIYELQQRYEPLILDRYDSGAHFKMDGVSTTWLGGWSNASGAWEVEDAYDQTERYLVNAANITHFAYLRLESNMIEGSTHTITDTDGNSVTFTYDKTSPSWAIKVNQEGYAPDSTAKCAYLGAWLGSYGTHVMTPTTFTLMDDSDNVVFTGTPVLRNSTDSAMTLGKTRKFTGEQVYQMDFSTVTTPGTYRIHIPGIGYSWSFVIGPQVVDRLFYTHARGLYHQRSGVAKNDPYTRWPMAKSQDITYNAPFPGEDKNLDGFKDEAGNWISLTAFNIINYRRGEISHRDVYGGWWDAADWDRRDYHLACVRSMCSAYLMYPNKFKDNQLHIPESGDGIPDILSEALWGMDVWRRCQREDGGVGLWIESAGHPNNADAVQDTRPFAMAEPTAYSSLHYALTAAQLSRALKHAGAYKHADLYADSAIRAFHWGESNLAHIEVTLNSIRYTYDEPAEKVIDRNWMRYRKQIMFWAAGQMYLLTNDIQYSKYLTDEYWGEYKATFDIEDSFFKNVFWELAETDLEPYASYMRNWIISKADLWTSYQDQYAYHDTAFPPGSNWAAAIAWGNCHPNARGQLWSVAYYLTQNIKYKTAIQHGINWLTGCNALGRTLTTGVGKVYPVRILSKIDQHLRNTQHTFDPVPGITCYTYGTNGLVSTAINNTYLLSKDAKLKDSNFAGCNINLMPGRLRNVVSTGGGPIAVYMEANLPMWRSHVPLQDFAVDMNEFTISETIAGNLLLLAPLLSEQWSPETSWKERTPITDPKQLEGYVFLP